jgi:lipoprotein-anchoring transpeptidase ErfK/SrfK
MSHAARFVRMAFASAVVALFSMTGSVETAAARQGEATSSARVVPFSGQFPAGTIVISQRERRLYLTLGDGRAIRYPVAVGKAGKAWSGWARVDGKHVNPAWAPPPVVRRDNPHLPDVIPGGSPSNPMGPRALTLDRSEIAIHGTTQSMRRSIGSAASYGCIRMLNEDIVDLFDRVRVGTAVVAIP